MRVVNQPVEDAAGHCGIADLFVPAGHGKTFCFTDGVRSTLRSPELLMPIEVEGARPAQEHFSTRSMDSP